MLALVLTVFGLISAFAVGVARLCRGDLLRSMAIILPLPVFVYISWIRSLWCAPQLYRLVRDNVDQWARTRYASLRWPILGPILRVWLGLLLVYDVCAFAVLRDLLEFCGGE
jgi:hypothetical protein